jgi:hypothetical protein
MNTDPVIYETLAHEVPLRTDLHPAWDDVLTRAEQRRSRGALRPRRHRILRSRWALVAALVAAAGLSVGGLALADAFGPLHGARLVINPSTLGGKNGISTCDLIGKTADQVAAKLTSSGIGIEWRFMHWGTTVVPTGKGSPTGITGGRTDVVSSVPNDSVVWDVSPDGQTKAFVFVQAPNDPNAPIISTGDCTS